MQKPRRAYFELCKQIKFHCNVLSLDEEVEKYALNLLPLILSNFKRIPRTYRTFSIAIAYYAYRKFNPQMTLDSFRNTLDTKTRTKLMEKIPDSAEKKDDPGRTFYLFYGFTISTNQKSLRKCYREIIEVIGQPNQFPFLKIHKIWLIKLGNHLNLPKDVIDSSIKLMNSYQNSALGTISSPDILLASLYVCSSQKNLGITYDMVLFGFYTIRKNSGILDYFDVPTFTTTKKFVNKLRSELAHI